MEAWTQKSFQLLTCGSCERGQLTIRVDLRKDVQWSDINESFRQWTEVNYGGMDDWSGSAVSFVFYRMSGHEETILVNRQNTKLCHAIVDVSDGLNNLLLVLRVQNA